MSSNAFGVCRSCGKRILWIRTKAGKNMPVNPEIIRYCMPEPGKKAEEKIVTEVGEVISADRASGERADGFGYISHFATCPGANRHRRK